MTRKPRLSEKRLQVLCRDLGFRDDLAEERMLRLLRGLKSDGTIVRRPCLPDKATMRLFNLI